MNRFKACFNVAKIFFAIGTCIFILHFIFRRIDAFIWIGYIYTMLSIVINSIIVIVLLIALIIERKRIETLKSIGIILANAPIAYGYFLLVIEYL